MKSPALFEDMNVLVTGAGKGLGRAVVEELLARHERFPRMRIALNARSEADLSDLAGLARQAGVETLTLPVDLARDPISIVETVRKKWGRIDALVHSAGVGRFGDFGTYSREDVEFVTRTNVEATFLLLQETFKLMKSQELKHGLRGQIQVITSVAAERPFEHSAVYCMSKYAQRGLLEVMRIPAAKERIRILDVRSGAALTPMWGSVDSGMEARMMKPVDVAGPMIDALLLDPRATLETLTIRPIGGDI
jgi:sepiapterin reductase